MVETKYTEAETEKFYDSEDSLYRSFWDSEGSLHWGYFENVASASPEDFLPACQRWNQCMLQKSGITNQSKVLDLGCGNGNTAIWLAQQTGCEVVGIDISQIRVDNARNKSKDYPKLNLSFEKASATNLPFAEGAFTHVWSQATIYHIHDRPKALEEICRVLKEGGTFLFDDLTTPKAEISDTARRYVYERLLFKPTFSQESYKEILTQLGLMVVESTDLSSHLQKSYQLLSQLAKPQYPDLSQSYNQMCEAIKQKDLGWSFFCCEKVSDRVSWVYSATDKQSLESKYDAWSRTYDQDLDNNSYRISPVESARVLDKVLLNQQASILDVGSGTGMVGEALAKFGYTNITGVDLSAEMLEVARKKQVYTALYQGDLEKTLDFSAPDSFDAIIAVGVFTYGHSNPQALKNLFPLLKSGGYFVLTVRVDYYESNKVLQEVIEELSWSLNDRTEFTIFDTESMYSLIFHKN